MSENLLELIGRDRLWAILSEVAAHLEETPNNIVDLKFWATGLWVKRRHNLAIIVSYRQLNCWIPLVQQTIIDCTEFHQLAQLREAMEIDFCKRPDAYPQKAREELQQLLPLRQAELEDENIWKAEMLTSSYSKMIKSCKTQAQLQWVRQVIRSQNTYLLPYPNLLEHLQQWANQQCQYLRRYVEV